MGRSNRVCLLGERPKNAHAGVLHVFPAAVLDGGPVTDKKMTYKDAGVDIEAGERFVEKIAPLVRSTFGPEVITDIGGFGGLFALEPGRYREPVLVSGTDGVGTKLKLAFLTGRHDSVGIDLVAMCVNDILVSGAQPLFFLDYMASGKLEVDRQADVVRGIVAGCRQARCALIGGETAEMPDFYTSDEYDLAGFAVGIVERSEMIDGTAIVPGDALIGMASSGLHSNGYSLVRRVVTDGLQVPLEKTVPPLKRPMGEVLLEPTRIYVQAVLSLIERFRIKGMAHITGGGLPGNLPRMLPKESALRVATKSWPVPGIFTFLGREGQIPEPEMFRTFNMGIGYCLVVGADQAQAVLETLNKDGETAWIIGEVCSGQGEVLLV